MSASETLNITVNEINGSEKQIVWAIELRGQMLDSLAAVADPNAYTVHKDMVGKLVSDSNATRVARATAMVLASIGSARWWIDNRDYLSGVRSKLTRHTEYGVEADNARAIQKVLSDMLISLRSSIPNFDTVFASAKSAA